MADPAEHGSDRGAILVQSPPNPAGPARASDLSVDETLLLDKAGFEVAGLATGICAYHVGLLSAWAGMSVNCELDQLSAALYHARARAVAHLAQQGQALGGCGVIGVDIELHPAGHGLIEFAAVGTAIRPLGKESSHPVVREVAKGGFFTSDLSGKDFLLLARAGYVPLGLVFGACVYHIARQAFSNWVNNQTANVELPTYTNALYDARELAMGRLQAEAEQLSADGIVGTRITEQSHVWGSHVIEFLAIGTAVRLVTGTHQLNPPSLAVPLDDLVVTTDPGAIVGV